MNINELNYSEMCKMIIDDWQDSFEDNDIRISQHMLELIQRRDSLEPWILSKIEIQSVLDMLAQD